MPKLQPLDRTGGDGCATNENTDGPVTAAGPSFFYAGAIALLVYSLLVFLLFLSSMHGYFWVGNDSPVAILRVQMLAEQWRANGLGSGDWLPGAMDGYGYPLFLFYPPLGYELSAAGVVLLHLGAGMATRFSFMFSVWLSGFFVFLYTWMTGRRAGCTSAVHMARWGLAAAVLFALAPFHLHQLFVIASLAECWVWPAAALFFLAMELSRARSWTGGLLFAVATAVLILSHVALAVYAALFGGLYVLLTRPTWRWLASLGAGGILGLALAAFYWLPAVALLPRVLAHLPGEDGSSAFAVERHVLTGFQMLTQIPNAAATAGVWRVPAWGGGIFITALVVALAVALARLLPKHKGTRSGFFYPSPRRTIAALLGLCALAFFIMSRFMPWDSMPQSLLLIQYPWRLLMPATLLAVLALCWAAGGTPRWLAPEIFTLAALALAVSALRGSLIEPTPAGVNDQTLRAYLEAQSPEATEALNTTYREFLPTTVKPEFYAQAFRQRAPLNRLQGPVANFRVLDFVRRGSVYAYRYTAPQPTRALLHVFFFPGWHAWIDEQRANEVLQLDAPSGLAALNLPAGTHTLRIAYTGTALQKIALDLSGAALLGCLLMGGVIYFRRMRRKANSAVAT